jgi:hypothetical protein
MTVQPLKFPLFLLTLGTLIGLGQSAQAQQQIAQTVETCPGIGGFPKYYVRIQTNSGEPLRVRSTPAGTPIGSIPSGWAVRVLEWSRNGYWVKVTSGPYDIPDSSFARTQGQGRNRVSVFGSAPDFREGWVSAGFVRDLGRFCEKPAAAAMLIQPQMFGAQPVEVQSDWLAMADQVAQTSQS